MNKLVQLVLCLILTACAKAQVSYKNFKAYTVVPSTEHHFELLQVLQENSNITFWSLHPAKLVVPPDFQHEFEDFLKQHLLDFQLLTEDVESLIIQERIAQNKVASKAKGEISFDKYYRYLQIQDYLKRLAKKYPNLVTLENYGRSYEYRKLTLLRISSGGNNKKQLIFVDAGIHAMEWIGPAQALYILDQLLENPKNKYLTEHVDWIVIPLLNPDGYEYSHTNNRFWRKTRSKGKLCNGVDPNRNFDFHWGGEGASKHECSFFYSGPSAFSEKETIALSKAIRKYANRTELYMTIHSPAQTIMYPWGYTSELPPNAAELQELAEEAANAIAAVNKTVYRVGNSIDTFRPAAGSSRDWAYAVGGINLSYTIELPAGGYLWFDMPPERILGVVQEFFEGVKVFHRYVEQKFVGVKDLNFKL